MAPSEPTSAVRDVIDRMRSDVSDLRYSEAVRRGNELLAFGSDLSPSQRVALRQVMAAAYYPQEVEAQQRDSAIAQLVELVKVAPDARIATELRWPGLDSLLLVARARTFAVLVRYPDESILVGTDGRAFIEVTAARPARYFLRVTPADGGDAVVLDSTIAGTRGRLAFRGHSGRNVLFANGDYDFTVIAIDGASGDSVSFTRRATASAEAPELVRLPRFNTRLLKPEISKPPRVRMAVAGVLFTAFTIAIASEARAEEPLRTAFVTDSRAILVGGAMIGATVASFFLDKGQAIPENIKSNLNARETHRLALADAERENRRRVATYRVTVRMYPEER